jgi:hypothetical protein
MSEAVTGIGIGAEILKAWGIDSDKVIGFTLNVQHDEAVTLTVQRYCTAEELDHMKRLAQAWMPRKEYDEFNWQGLQTTDRYEWRKVEN